MLMLWLKIAKAFLEIFSNSWNTPMKEFISNKIGTSSTKTSLQTKLSTRTFLAI